MARKCKSKRLKVKGLNDNKKIIILNWLMKSIEYRLSLILFHFL